MKIEYIKITNFRGLNIELTNLENSFLIMGRNDTGKSNLCYAIRKVLDPLIRRTPLIESDSTNHNKEDIMISIKVDVTNISTIQRSKIGDYLDNDEAHEYLSVTLVGEYNEELYFYEEKIIVGEVDKKEFATNKTNKIDSVLDVIYIEPNYNYEKNISNYFLFKKKDNEDNNKSISTTVLNQTNAMNEAIKNDDVVKDMTLEINDNVEFEEIFENVKFDITSKVDISNICKSLDISFVDENGQNVGNLGDGKVKTLSMLLKKSSYSKEKAKIIIIEEPENHMYPLLQKSYTKLIEQLHMDQFIFTSHSPYIFDLKKMDQIVRLTKEKNITKYSSINIEENTYSVFGYMMNEEIGEILFYDTVLLVEGVSEKYFYNALYHYDEKFRKYCLASKMEIFNIAGVDFNPIKNFLSKLGIKVLIKTDNDIFKVPKIDKKRYAGIERVIECLDDNSKKELCILLGVKVIEKETFRFSNELEVNEEIEKNMKDIQSIFIKNGVYLSIGHDGFEEDFLQFVGYDKIPAEDLKYLKEAKLKNFHKYVIDQNIKFEINDQNKNSILVE
ncbi:ATP-dependent nuclease [Thomasclavelia spiroformis]|uniref:ATP-dependent nuclease n=1 Tax=Thomasclavelia spiroformis TaxID=29348 RepID=UPI003993C116